MVDDGALERLLRGQFVMFRRVLRDQDVLTCARQRVAEVFDGFDRVCVSFSGGKDSTVLLHLAIEEAARRGRRITVLFIDWEAQLDLTIRFVRSCLDEYRDHVDPIWVCLPLRTTNACSQIEPEWTCWDPAKRPLWVREPPEGSVTDPLFFPFYRHAMTFEEFVPAFGAWFGRGGAACSLVGVRAAESLNRYRALVQEKETWGGRRWTTRLTSTDVWNAYPLYDWKTEDVWTYFGRTGQSYNPVYDRMYQAGLSIHQMRVCEPYGDEQRRGLWLYHVIEPETWSRVCARVAGASTGAMYAGERGNVLGNGKVTLPEGHTWESFARFLLDTMPHDTAEHYRGKIAVYLKWYRDHGVPVLPDMAVGDTGSQDVGSWRRICKTLLKQDYWCKSLCFSPTKTAAYGAYREMMARRRSVWGIFPPEAT